MPHGRTDDNGGSAHNDSCPDDYACADDNTCADDHGGAHDDPRADHHGRSARRSDIKPELHGNE